MIGGLYFVRCFFRAKKTLHWAGGGGFPMGTSHRSHCRVRSSTFVLHYGEAGTTWVRGAGCDQFKGNGAVKIRVFVDFVGLWGIVHGTFIGCLRKITWILCEITWFMLQECTEIGTQRSSWILCNVIDMNRWIELRIARVGWLLLGLQQQDTGEQW